MDRPGDTWTLTSGRGRVEIEYDYDVCEWVRGVFGGGKDGKVQEGSGRSERSEWDHEESTGRSRTQCPQ